MSVIRNPRFRLGVMSLLVLAGASLLAFPRLSGWWKEYQREHTPLPTPREPMALNLGPAGPDDWPQWRGPRRDGVSAQTGLLTDWPANGPKLLWTFDGAGAGYSAPAVVGGVAFVPGARDNAEYVVALDAARGHLLGEVVINHVFEHSYGSGPRSTPTYDAGKIYALSGSGDLVCVDTATGQVVWRKNIYRDLGSTVPIWGCGESPLVDGDLVVCTPGGDQGTVAAFHKLTGELAWRCTALTDPAGYSSLVVSEARGVRQYVQITFESVAGIAAADGKLLWRYPRRGPNAPVPTPLVSDDLVYATSGYGAGCNLIQLLQEGPNFDVKERYANKVMSNHHGGVLLIDGHVYGYADHKGWTCQNLASGKMVWSEKSKLGKGSLSAADGRLYCYAEDDGTCLLLAPSSTGWQEHGRLVIPRQTGRPRGEGKIWSHPVIAEGKLYLRDQELLFCYDIKAP
jgi:outer membrane protein assembly factor BamB